MKKKCFSNEYLPNPGDLIKAQKTQMFLCVEWPSKKTLQQTCVVRQGDPIMVLYKEQKKVIQMNTSVSVRPDSVFYLFYKGYYYIAWSESYLIKNSIPFLI